MSQFEPMRPYRAVGREEVELSNREGALFMVGVLIGFVAGAVGTVILAFLLVALYAMVG